MSSAALPYLGPIGSVIGGIGSLVGGIGSSSSSSSASRSQLQAVRETNATNMAIAQSNNEAARALWREQSEYNSPYNQMQRYLEAGLNPNLMASSGQVNSGNAATPPTLQQAHVAPYTGYVRDSIAKYSGIMDAMKGLQSTMMNLADLTNRNQDTKTKAAQEGYYDALRFKTMQDAYTGMTMRPLNALIARYNANWLGYRQGEWNELQQDPLHADIYNPWKNQWRLGYYNQAVAAQNYKAKANENFAWSLYGLKTALAKLENIKSSTQRNLVAAKIQNYLAPAMFTNYMNMAGLNQERMEGQGLQNDYFNWNWNQERSGGNIGFTPKGFKFTLKDLKNLFRDRAYSGGGIGGGR